MCPSLIQVNAFELNLLVNLDFSLDHFMKGTL